MCVYYLFCLQHIPEDVTMSAVNLRRNVAKFKKKFKGAAEKIKNGPNQEYTFAQIHSASPWALIFWS